MHIKLVKDGTVVGLYECSHISTKRFPSLDSPTRKAVSRETGLPPFSPSDIGYEIELCGTDTAPLRIPRDGDSVYAALHVVVDGAIVEKTVQSYHVDKNGNPIKGEQARQLVAK